jgi:hypothetical protein
VRLNLTVFGRHSNLRARPGARSVSARAGYPSVARPADMSLGGVEQHQMSMSEVPRAAHLDPLADLILAGAYSKTRERILSESLRTDRSSQVGAKQRRISVGSPLVKRVQARWQISQVKATVKRPFGSPTARASWSMIGYLSLPATSSTRRHG